jgi:hypothetical protein
MYAGLTSQSPSAVQYRRTQSRSQDPRSRAGTKTSGKTPAPAEGHMLPEVELGGALDLVSIIQATFQIFGVFSLNGT